MVVVLLVLLTYDHGVTGWQLLRGRYWDETDRAPVAQPFYAARQLSTNLFNSYWDLCGQWLGGAAASL